MPIRVPTPTVRVAFATAPGATPTWTDVSAYVRRVSGDRGRQRAFERHKASTCSVVLDNRDRRFDPTHATGPYFGNVLPMRRVQVTAGHLGMVLRHNPRAFWRLGESSGTTAQDETENNNDATYVNTPTLGVTGRIPGNTAVTFDLASSEHATGPDLSVFEAGNCTYLAWFKTTDTTAQSRDIFSEGTTSGGNGFSVLRISATHTLNCQARNDAATNYNVTGTTVVNDGAWHLGALVKSGTTMSLYVDGVSEGTPVTIAGVFTQNRSVIGALGRSTVAEYFAGTIDEVAVIPSALTAAQIRAIYDEGVTGHGDGYLFTGYADSWAQEYDIGNKDAVCVLGATDAFKVFANATLPSVYEIEVRADTPRAWWPLNDSEGSTVAADAVGAYPGAYEEANERAAGPVYGAGESVPRFHNHRQYVSLPQEPTVNGTAAWTYELWFRHSRELDTAVGEDLVLLQQGNRDYVATDNFVYIDLVYEVGVDATRELALMAQDSTTQRFASHESSLYTDTGWHQIVATMDTGTLKLYSDGVLRSTDSGNVPVLQQKPLFVNAYVFRPNGTVDWEVDYAHLSVYGDDLTAARVLAHYNAATQPWADDNTGTRLGRVLDYLAWPAADRNIDTGNSTMLPAILERSALDHLQEIESTEAGRVYMARDGKVTFKKRHTYMTDSNYRTSQTTFGDSTGEVPYTDLVLEYDDADIANVVRVSAPNQPTQVAEDSTSKTAYGTRTKDLQVHESSALRMRDAAHWYLGRHKDPALIARSLTLNPRRDATTLFPVIFARDLGHRVTVKRRPQAVGSAISQETLIEGEKWDIDAAAQSWRHSYWLSPAETRTYWRLGNATDGKLGTTTRLAW